MGWYKNFEVGEVGTKGYRTKRTIMKLISQSHEMTLPQESINTKGWEHKVKYLTSKM